LGPARRLYASISPHRRYLSSLYSAMGDWDTAVYKLWTEMAGLYSDGGACFSLYRGLQMGQKPFCLF
jgi:hypothetical protein